MASTYDLMEYDSEEEAENEPFGPPRENLFAAFSYIGRLLSANGIDHAALGGFAMICRGSKRNTRDIDIATDIKMSRLWEVITPQTRLKIPNTRLIEGVIKIFVETGPQFEDPGCSEERWIDVDLLTPGFKGTPTRLTDHTDILPVTIGEEHREIPCLDILYMMRSKLGNCTSRALDRDIEDTQYLFNHFGKEVSKINAQLNQDEVDQFLDMDWLKEVDPNDRAYYRRLLGR